MLKQLWKDEDGFIICAELVLVATLLVIGLIVGLSEVQHAVVSELNDVGEAIGCLNQSFQFSGFAKFSGMGRTGISATTSGSVNFDRTDDCDNNDCDINCLAPTPEGPQDCGT